jgi:hypothetical protein
VKLPPALLVFVLAAASCAGAPLMPNPPAPNESLQRLSWMAGTWRSVDGELAWEEYWTRPMGDSIVGVARSLTSGETKLYELMSIEVQEKGTFLVLRHFERELVPWESEADGPKVMTLVGTAPNRAVFEDPTAEFPRRLTYERPDRFTLIARLEGAGKAAGRVKEFRFRNVP